MMHSEKLFPVFTVPKLLMLIPVIFCSSCSTEKIPVKEENQSPDTVKTQSLSGITLTPTVTMVIPRQSGYQTIHVLARKKFQDQPSPHGNSKKEEIKLMAGPKPWLK